MFKSNPDQSKLIWQEIFGLSVELDTIVACHDPKLSADDNHDLVTISHEHAATTLNIPSSAGNGAVSEPGSPQVKDSLRLPQSGALAEGLSNCTLHESKSHRPAPDIEPSQIPPHDRTNSSIISTDGQRPGNEGTHQSTLQESSHNPEWPQSPPTPQGPSSPFSPIQYSSPQLPSAEYPPSQSPPPQSAPPSTLQESSHNPEWSQGSLTSQGSSLQSSSIKYSPSQLSPAESPPSQSQAPQSPHQISFERQDGIIRLFPTAEQWNDIPAILRFARALGVEEVGICKAVLPEGVVGLSKPIRYTKQKRFRYQACRQSNGTFGLSRKEEKVAPKNSPKPVDMPLGTLAAAQAFEQLLRKKSGLKGVAYSTDIDVRRPKDRKSLGLPTSPVWHLKGDRLLETRTRIPGIHWPYAYESSGSFGAPFAMHVEDGYLWSVNYLYVGDKYWVAIPRSHFEAFEQKARETNGSYYLTDCAQFLRHSATYFPTSILGEWNVPYKVAHQETREAIITCPRVYHEGFSKGYTFAEAANYADQDWNIQGYQFCDSRYCPEGFISKEMLEFRNEDEEQHSEESSEDDGNHNSLAEETQPSTTRPEPPKRKRVRPSSIGSPTHQPEIKRTKCSDKLFSFPTRSYSDAGIPVRKEDRVQFERQIKKTNWTSDIMDPLNLGDRLNVDHDNKCEVCGHVQGCEECCLDTLSEPQLEIRYINHYIEWGVVSLVVRVSWLQGSTRC